MSDTPTPSPTPVTADQYIDKELATAKKTLKNTMIWGSVIVALLSIETLWVTAQFYSAMEPTEAATIAGGFVRSQLDDHADQLQMEIEERVPAIMQSTPEYAITEMPKYRAAIEQKVDDALTTYVGKTSSDLGTQLDSFLDASKPQLQDAITNASDPNAAKALTPALHTALLSYINEKPADGESITQKIGTSLAELTDVEKKLYHLANGKNLTPQELETRHAIAVLTDSVKKQNLPTVPVKEAVAAAGQ